MLKALVGTFNEALNVAPCASYCFFNPKSLCAIIPTPRRFAREPGLGWKGPSKMEWGELLTRGLAQLAAACYLLRLLADMGGSPSPSLARGKRWLWILGCAALWLHVAAAFQFFHHWSQADAVRQTAEQTRKMTGWAWGGGVYINYAFMLLWLVDVVQWWRRGEADAQSNLRYWATQSVFGFMMFNATVVFGPAYWRYIGIAFAGVAIAVRASRHHEEFNHEKHE